MTANTPAAGTGFHATGDDRFAKALGDFARRIGERAAAERAPDPLAAAEKRRAALAAHDRDRMQRWLIGSSVAVGLVAVVGLLTLAMMWLPISLGRAGVPVVEQRKADTRAGYARDETIVTAGVPPAQARSPSQPVVIVVPAIPESPVVSMAELKAWARPVPGGLSAAEIREVQGRLLTLGYDPGRIDGADGPRTQAAVRRYRERRSLLPANGTIDRNLLTALRQDPSPRIAQKPPRSSDPFEPIVRWWRSL